jgi:hypothetical protein
LIPGSSIDSRDDVDAFRECLKLLRGPSLLFDLMFPEWGGKNLRNQKRLTTNLAGIPMERLEVTTNTVVVTHLTSLFIHFLRVFAPPYGC